MYKHWIDTYTTSESFKPSINVIMTTYFCNKKHYQSGSEHKSASCNDFKYIKPWYNSVKNLNLNGIIFHDGLSDEFIKKYETSYIKFVYVNSKDYNYSLNDLRFFVYLEHIHKNPDIQNIFMTDGNDVTVVKNPFKLNLNKLYVGNETGITVNYILKHKKVGGMYKKISEQELSRLQKFSTSPLLNAGIVGGNRNNIIKLLTIMTDYFKKDSCLKCNMNMGVLNQSVYNNFSNYFTGEPLHSAFFGFQNNRKDVYFIHK